MTGFLERYYRVLKKKEVSVNLDILIELKTYDGTVASLRIVKGETSEFSMTIGLHWESTSNPCLFAFLVDEITRNTQEDVPWYMLV